jgi:hypothetical protein
MNEAARCLVTITSSPHSAEGGMNTPMIRLRSNAEASIAPRFAVGSVKPFTDDCKARSMFRADGDHATSTTSAAFRGRPGRCRLLPSCFFATSSRYHRRIVSGVAIVATSASAFRPSCLPRRLVSNGSRRLGGLRAPPASLLVGCLAAELLLQGSILESPFPPPQRRAFTNEFGAARACATARFCLTRSLYGTV